MNQRFSKCASIQDELSHLPTARHPKAARKANNQPEVVQDDNWVLDTEEHDANAMDIDSEPEPPRQENAVSDHDLPQPQPEPHFQSGPDGSQYYITEHPSAAYTYGQGKTFMDEFRKDEFAHCRETTANVYYPFDSSAEWELGSFLLRSSLSMADTDQFLKLKMVSVNYYGFPQFK